MSFIKSELAAMQKNATRSHVANYVFKTASIIMGMTAFAWLVASVVESGQRWWRVPLAIGAGKIVSDMITLAIAAAKIRLDDRKVKQSKA